MDLLNLDFYNFTFELQFIFVCKFLFSLKADPGVKFLFSKRTGLGPGLKQPCRAWLGSQIQARFPLWVGFGVFGALLQISDVLCPIIRECEFSFMF